MDDKEFARLFFIFDLDDLVEDISDDGDGILRLTPRGEQLVLEIREGFEEVRDEGYQRCLNDIETEEYPDIVSIISNLDD